MAAVIFPELIFIWGISFHYSLEGIEELGLLRPSKAI